MKEAFDKLNKMFKEEIRLANEDKERYIHGNNHYQFGKAVGYEVAMTAALENIEEIAEEYKDKYVSIGAYKQTAWERDIAIEQLNELGYSFGENIEPTFKVYQIRRCSGEWEDYHERIVGCYMSEKKAIAEKERLELEEAEIGNCNKCPLYFCEPGCDHDCESCAEDKKIVEKVKEYCKRYEPFEDLERDCRNRNFIYDEAWYRIDEIEVTR